MSDVYDIRVAGRMGPALLQMFASMSPRIVAQRTVLRGRLDDDADLVETTRRLQEVGIDVADIRVMRPVRGLPLPCQSRSTT